MKGIISTHFIQDYLNKRYKLVIPFALILMLFLSTNDINAQWQQTNGPYGGAVRNIVFDGDDIYALGTVGAMFKRTTMEGEWQSIGTPLINGAYIVDYAMVDDNILVATSGGIFFSSDKGNTWESRSNGISNFDIVDMTSIGNTILVVTGYSGEIYFSDDFGNSWQNKSDRIYPDGKLLLCATQYNNEFYIGFDTFTNIGGVSGGGLYKSKDLGETWELVAFDNIGVKDIKFEDDTIYSATKSGFYKSIDKGENWVKLNNGIVNPNFLICFEHQKDNYFLGASDGLYISTDQGQKWSKSNLINSMVFSIRKHDEIIYVCSQDGIYYSNNKGKDWDSDLNIGFIATQNLDINSLNGKVITSAYGYGVYTTDDEGETWDRSKINTMTQYFNSIAVIDDVIYAAQMGSGIIFYSTDEAKTWNTDLMIYNIKTVSSLVKAGDNLLAITDKGELLSTDQGKTWQQMGFLNSFVTIRNFQTAGDKVFAATTKGLLVSEDDGFTWDFAPTDLADTMMNLTSMAITGNTVYSHVLNEGFVVSNDLGKTWHKPQNNNLPDSILISSYAIYGVNLFISVADHGVFLTTDKGENWEQVNDGFTNYLVAKLTVVGDDMYAATSGSGVYKAKITDFNISYDEDDNGDDDDDGNSVEDWTAKNSLYAYPPYPMPAVNEVRSLVYCNENADIENCEIKIYNIYGKEVSGKDKIRLDVQTYNSANLVWDCSEVPAGTYLIHINSGTESNIIKVVVGK